MSILVNKISKKYGNQTALDGISFSINKGEIVGFLGPNGAGKSTLMKILTTSLMADSGEARVHEYNIATEAQKVKKIIGYLPEHNPLYLDLYVREYLAFNAQVYHVPVSRIEEVIQLTGLTEAAHKKIGALSKGFRQRVGLAAALLHDPEVLILDEPTTGLDPNQLTEIRSLIKNIGQNKTVFLSTHIMQEVEALCNRVIIINQGKIVADHPIEQMLNSDELQVIEVEFDQQIDPDLWQQLPFLKESIALEKLLWQLTFDTKEDMRATIFDFAQSNGLKILALQQKNKDLETLFREKTHQK